MIENSNCETSRAQLISFNDFYGTLSMKGLTITNHRGAFNNAYLTTGGAGNLNLPLTLLSAT